MLMRYKLFLVFAFIGFPAFGSDNAAFYASLEKKLPQTEGMTRMPRVNGRAYRADCSGYVSFIFHWAGLDLLKLYGIADNGVSAIWLGLEKFGFEVKGKTLQTGDIVFFHNTYDRNRNGKRDDAFTHIGVVESVDAYGTARVLHHGSKGVAVMRVNPKTPDLRSLSDGDETVVFNDYLRRGGAKAENLAGYLYAGAMRLKLKKKS